MEILSARNSDKPDPNSCFERTCSFLMKLQICKTQFWSFWVELWVTLLVTATLQKGYVISVIEKSYFLLFLLSYYRVLPISKPFIIFLLSQGTISFQVVEILSLWYDFKSYRKIARQDKETMCPFCSFRNCLESLYFPLTSVFRSIWNWVVYMALVYAWIFQCVFSNVLNTLSVPLYSTMI